MKTAIDCYARGKQREANADEYSRARIYNQGRFICPECGELVHLTGSKYSNHFAHYKKTDVSAQCDRRIDGLPTQSVYERIGLPLYLRKDDNNDFRLFMGFRTLPIKVLEQAEKNNLSFKIIGTKQNYKITHERFINGETTLLPILHIPLGQSKYRLKYSPQMYSASVLSYWSDEADGFSDGGALFSVTGLGGKKVRHGDTISTDTKYYWVRRNASIPSYISGINMKRVGDLILKDNKYHVFRGSFDSSISDMEFDRLTTYLRETYKVLQCKNNCTTACHDCLKHYWNQRVHNRLDRIAAKQLLDWCTKEQLASGLSFAKQLNIIAGIRETALLDADFTIKCSFEKMWIEKGSKKIRIYIYPAMWTQNNINIPEGCIAISDKMLLSAMPYAYSKIRDEI